MYECSEVSIYYLYLFAGEMPTISYYKPIASSHLIMPRHHYTVNTVNSSVCIFQCTGVFWLEQRLSLYSLLIH